MYDSFDINDEFAKIASVLTGNDSTFIGSNF